MLYLSFFGYLFKSGHLFKLTIILWVVLFVCFLLLNKDKQCSLFPNKKCIVLVLPIDKKFIAYNCVLHF